MLEGTKKLSVLLALESEKWTQPKTESQVAVSPECFSSTEQNHTEARNAKPWGKKQYINFKITLKYYIHFKRNYFKSSESVL